MRQTGPAGQILDQRQCAKEGKKNDPIPVSRSEKKKRSVRQGKREETAGEWMQLQEQRAEAKAAVGKQQRRSK